MDQNPIGKFFQSMPKRKRLILVYYLLVVLFCVVIISYFKIVWYNDYCFTITVLSLQVAVQYYRYYPPGSISRKQFFVLWGGFCISGILLVVAITEAFGSTTVLKYGRVTQTTAGSGGPGFALVGILIYLGSVVYSPLVAEFYYRKNKRTHGATVTPMQQLSLEKTGGEIERDGNSNNTSPTSSTAVETIEDQKPLVTGKRRVYVISNLTSGTQSDPEADDVSETEHAHRIRSEIYGLTLSFEEKWTKGSYHFPIGISVTLMMVASQTVFVTFGWFTYDQSGALNMMVFALWAARVLWESGKSPPIRGAQGHYLVFVFVGFGASTIPRTAFTLSESVNSSLGHVLVFVAFLTVMAFVTYVIWKGSILWGDLDQASIFPIMALDDLFGDTILGSQTLDPFFIISVVVMIIRLIVRDTGMLEDMFNRFWEWNRPGSLSKEQRMEELNMTEREKEEFRMYRKLQFHSKYIKIAKMDLLTEHLSVLVIPVLLVTDRYLGGNCIFYCGKTDEQIWTNVLIFVVLFFAKSMVNGLVLKIQDRQMDHLQTELDAFQEKWGKLSRDSPLNVWAPYIQGDIPSKLKDQVVIAKTKIMERNFLWFWITSCAAAMAAVYTVDEAGWA